MATTEQRDELGNRSQMRCSVGVVSKVSVTWLMKTAGMPPRRSKTELRFRLHLAVRKHDRNDLHFVLPDHALHVDGNAADTGIAAGLLGASAEDRFNFADRHAGFDFGVVVLRDGVATATNEEKGASQQQGVFQWVHVGNPWECERNELLSGDVVPFAVSEMDTTEVVNDVGGERFKTTGDQQDCPDLARSLKGLMP